MYCCHIPNECNIENFLNDEFNFSYMKSNYLDCWYLKRKYA